MWARYPAELVIGLLNHDGLDAVFGAFATIDRWDDREWRPYRELLLCVDAWNCGDDPRRIGGDVAMPDIGLTAQQGSIGIPQRFTTGGLTRGWYRVTQYANDGTVARAVFEVAIDADRPAPLDATNQPAISVTPFVVSPQGARLELGTFLATTGSASRDNVEQAVEGLEEVVSVDRWGGHTWHSVRTIALGKSAVDMLIRITDVPALIAREYRLVRAGPNGSHSGRFWVADLAA